MNLNAASRRPVQRVLKDGDEPGSVGGWLVPISQRSNCGIRDGRRSPVYRRLQTIRQCRLVAIGNQVSAHTVLDSLSKSSAGTGNSGDPSSDRLDSSES